MEYKKFDELPTFISIPEAADFLGVSRPSLYKQIEKDDSFPLLRIGRRCLIPTEQLGKWIDEHSRNRGGKPNNGLQKF